MKVSFSSLLRWGGRQSAPPTPPAAAARDASSERRDDQRWPVGGSAQMSWIDPQGRPQNARVRLRNQGDGGMAVFSPRPAPIQHPVWLILESGADRQGITTFCESEERGFRIGINLVHNKRAPQRRIPWSVATRMKWLDPLGALVSGGVLVQNSGDGEVSAITAEPVPVPSIVLLSAKEVRCLASTRECQQDGDQYLLHLEVIGDTYAHPLADSA